MQKDSFIMKKLPFIVILLIGTLFPLIIKVNMEMYSWFIIILLAFALLIPFKFDFKYNLKLNLVNMVIIIYGHIIINMLVPNYNSVFNYLHSLF